MTFPPPAAPPFLATYFFESKTEPMGFEIRLFMKGPTDYISAMTQAKATLTVYLTLMVPDVHCLKISITDQDVNVKGDSWDAYLLTGEFSGTYAPTVGADISALDYQTGIKQRWQNTTSGVHETRHIRPVPRTLVTDGKTLVPDTAYSDALANWESQVQTAVTMVTVSPGGTALQSTVDEIVEDFHVGRVPGGEPHFLKRGRARSQTIVPS
jgi:hypothetical protein